MGKMPMLLMLLAITAGWTQASSSNCREYEAKLESRPDFTHNVVFAESTLPPEFAITDVQQDMSKEHSYYWCELNEKDLQGQPRTLKRYGHNTTHWWVTRGCGGWFRIQGCRGARAPTPASIIDPITTPTIVIAIPAPFTAENADGGIRVLKSVMAWLKADAETYPEGRSAEDIKEDFDRFQEKLVVNPNYKHVRTVDEEFELEFGSPHVTTL